jgi:hypothetical protein
MTNASMYVYDKLEDYMKLYPGTQDLIAENHLASIMINEKTVALISDTNKGTAGYRPDLSKSLIYFDQGEDDFEKINKKLKGNFEHVTEVQYDPKKGEIIFSGQETGKHFAVARKYGEDEYKGLNHVRGYILYDSTRLRVNLIMTPVKH